jgi:hypothetical protein
MSLSSTAPINVYAYGSFLKLWVFNIYAGCGRERGARFSDAPCIREQRMSDANEVWWGPLSKTSLWGHVYVTLLVSNVRERQSNGTTDHKNISS